MSDESGEVSEAELVALVEAALSGGDVPSSSSERDPGVLEGAPGSPLLSVYPSTIFAKLHEILGEYVAPANRTVILDQIRDGLLGELRSPDLRQLHTRVKNCRACGDQVLPKPTLPLYNVSDPDVVVVIDGIWKGTPGDELLINSLAGAGFRSARLAITNTYRCPLNGNAATVASRCMERYLYGEITSLRPRLVITTGSAPARLLLGDDRLQVTKVRGTIFWLGSFPVLPTYSGAYATRSESVVADLQTDLANAYSFVYG